MNHQLTLAVELNTQSTLNDFFWGENTQLKLQIESILAGGDERFLYIWGPTGSGKSHLLQGCCHAANFVDPISYLPLAVLKEWGPESIEGIETHALVAIDDLDSIAGDSAWEEALFHFYNRARDNNNTIIILAGQNPPTSQDIQLADLRSRLSWGLVYHLAELSDDLKIQALQEHAKKRGFVLEASVALFLLRRYSRNMHALYLLLEQLDKASLAAQRKITIPFIKSTITF